ncbi:YbfB/YjiJ family MFS transporter [Acinetobacter larvae]|uniref:Major facilitator superfamily (MFS) profile domain-containing protein n=1 Tax=Acinetobacter larvae TaxID=1789224 RepID=A0A1B2LZM9_9GAMM|nr:YbfB/YjiJ family MFS transporter [Acinetobacter larvae]AOA58400.1 hypothetical protein BFG52_08565 [Acinetobacter larvae]
MKDFRYLCIIALGATCLGIGLFRFSYTALLALSVDLHWWSARFASYLASANLLGYLLGALLAFRAIPHAYIRQSVLFSALLGSLSLICCGIQAMPLYWYLCWRIISGVAGGLLMVLGPSYALQYVAQQHKNLFSFISFSGIGLGIVFSTTFLPLLAQQDLARAWFVLGILSFIISALIFWGLRQHASQLLSLKQQQPSQSQDHPLQRQPSIPQSMQQAAARTLNARHYRIAGLIIFCYALSAIAYIPHSLFWVDYLIHHLDLSVQYANRQWMFYGFGSMLGALLTYLLLRRFSLKTAMCCLYSSYGLAIALPAFCQQAWAISLSSITTGMLNPAIVSLSSSLLAAYLGITHHRSFWGMATIAFAVAQLIGGLLMSYLRDLQFDYQQLFLFAAALMVIAFLCSLSLQAMTDLSAKQQESKR